MLRLALSTILGGSMALLGYWVGSRTQRPALPCPACPACIADLDEIATRLDHLDARCVLLPERDRLAVAPARRVP